MSLSSVTSTALSGVSAAESILDVTANNLANLQTTGFKQSRVELATLPPAGTSPSLQVGTGARVAAVAPDGTQGALLPGNGPWSMAVVGDGYFMVQDSQGRTRYTRDGTFSVDADGQLVSADGNRVLGQPANRLVYDPESMPLFILRDRTVSQSAGGNPQDPISAYQIGSNGLIRGVTTSGTTRSLGQLQLARFQNPSGLQAVGNNNYQATASSGLPNVGNPATAGFGQIEAGALEASNTDVAANLISMSRAELLFRANLRTLSVADQLWQDLLDMTRR